VADRLETRERQRMEILTQMQQLGVLGDMRRGDANPFVSELALIQVVSLEVVAARAASLLMDLERGVAVSRKHAQDFQLLAQVINLDLRRGSLARPPQINGSFHVRRGPDPGPWPYWVA
jgi:hypothetical protein